MRVCEVSCPQVNEWVTRASSRQTSARTARRGMPHWANELLGRVSYFRHIVGRHIVGGALMDRQMLKMRVGMNFHGCSRLTLVPPEKEEPATELGALSA